MATPCALFAFHEVVRLGVLWKWSLFVGFGEVFCEACTPLPMGEGPGVRSVFGEFFCFL